ncbi:MAG: VOC family protein [Candidatus Eremiobacteraeota bacterium]|nr:VOC family protein [Candidatus Eremiobacteraeota bacterium]
MELEAWRITERCLLEVRIGEGNFCFALVQASRAALSRGSCFWLPNSGPELVTGRQPLNADVEARGVVSLEGLSFHHIGVACRDLDTEERAFATLGYRRETPEFFDPIQGIRGRFLVGGGPQLELLRNNTEPGVLSIWLKKGVRFYHLAYETNDLIRQASALVQLGAKEVTAPVPAVAYGGRLICFHMLPNLTLVELISRV